MYELNHVINGNRQTIQEEKKRWINITYSKVTWKL